MLTLITNLLHNINLPATKHIMNSDKKLVLYKKHLNFKKN